MYFNLKWGMINFILAGVFVVFSVAVGIRPYSAIPNTLLGIYLLTKYYRQQKTNSVK